MPLPEYGAKFPPKPFDEVQKDMRMHNAWFTGSTADLENYYAQNQHTRSVAAPGGGFGRIARFFWGRPNPQVNQKLHIPAAADLSRSFSDLLFSQRPKFSLSEKDSGGGGSTKKAAQQRLDALFNGDDTAAALLEAAEIGSALGGAYMRLWWDADIEQRVMLGSVSADRAIPTFRYDRLDAVTFWTVVMDENDTVLRHLERHERGRILHGLYEGDGATLGRPIPLDESEATAWAAPLVDSNSSIPTGVKGLTASYVPNVRPNRRHRNTAQLSPLGRSDYDGLEPIFDALDEAYTSWMRDLDLGKARLFIDEGLVKNDGPGRGGSFDSEQSIFTKLRAGMGSAADGGSGVQANQFSIRWQEHSQTCAELLNVILRGAGLSSEGFSDSSLTVGVPTATEVNSRDKLSERTRDKKINYWKMGLRPLAMTAMEIDADMFGSGIQLSEIPDLRFPTRSTQSPAELAQSLSALHTARAISIYQMVVERNPDWDAEDITAEVKRIADEDAAEFGAPVEPDEQDELEDPELYDAA
jgi:A118 family predicted phage portal protein